MNVFATLKTVFFGSKFLSSPVPIDGTPRRDLVSALNGLMPLCRTIPGVRLALDIREGQVVLALNWTPRTDGNASTGSLPLHRVGRRRSKRDGRLTGSFH
ncbi:hypothetical protein E1I95_25335 [Phocaeicola dorei]|nr:hypothetical protein E1J02_26575 [Phocaeicola dorei]TDB09790.1 hypothetical protein E1I95_25335 [Phocaeicola dorei]